MMLFPSQCAITKELITNGEDVVAMILESSRSVDETFLHMNRPVNSVNSFFMPSTLPIIGKFYDGAVLANNPCDLACEFAYSLYGINFSRSDETPYCFKNFLMSETGKVKSGSITFIIKYSVYLEILKSHTVPGFLQDFKDDAFYRTLSSNFHISLFCLMRDKVFLPNDINQIVDALCLFSGLWLLGYYFFPELTEPKEGFNSLLCRLNFNNSVVFKDYRNDSSSGSIAMWRCSVTGRAIYPKEIVHVIPVANNMFLDETTAIGDILPVEIHDLYGIAGTSCPIEIIDNNQFKILGSMGDHFLSLAGNPSIKNREDADLHLLEKIINSEILIKSNNSSCKSLLSPMIISDDAYQYLMADFDRTCLMNGFYHWEHLAIRLRQLIENSIYKRSDLSACLNNEKFDHKIIQKILTCNDDSVFMTMTSFKKYLTSCLAYQFLVGDDDGWRFAKIMDAKYSGLSGVISSWIYSKAKRIILSDDSSEVFSLLEELGSYYNEISKEIHILEKFRILNIVIRPTWLVKTNLSIKKTNILNNKIRKGVFKNNEAINQLVKMVKFSQS